MEKGTLNIGCSGFMYREWKEHFYPQKLPQRKWLEYYASQFNSLELNSSFYKFPEAEALKKYGDVTPENFTISLKAPRLITHHKQMNECHSQLNDLYTAVADGLGKKAGAILFQFPPKFSYSTDRLNKICTQLDANFINVVEFRNESWFSAEVLNVLAANNITVSGLSHPSLTMHQQLISNGENIYYRFHGIPKLFYSAYQEEELHAFCQNLLMQKKDKTVFVYFNNTASLAAIENGLKLKDCLQATL